MSWWNRTKPVEPEIIEAKAGEIVPCADPQNVIIVPPKEPEPDLSTKPKDIVGYCFGYVCPKKHVGGKFEEITVDGYKERRLCQECGAVSRPAIIKQSASPIWKDWGHHTGSGFSCNNGLTVWSGPWVPDWKWNFSRVYKNTTTQNMLMSVRGSPIWEKFEFVRYLDTPKTTRRKK